MSSTNEDPARTFGKPSRLFRRREDLAAIPGLALAIVLSISYLGAKSLWLDEASSVLVARLDGATRLQMISHAEPNMSLYYVLLHLWLAFGASEAAVRSLSALAAVLSILPLYWMCRRLFGVPHAAVAGTLLAANAFFIQYAQEARSYALVLLLVTASSALLLRALARPSVLSWILYVIVAAVGVYAHLFAAFVILAHTCFVLLWRRTAIRFVVAADVAIGLLLVPLLLWIRNAGPKSTWIPRPRLLSLTGAFVDLTGAGGKPLAAAYLLVCGLGVYSVIISKRRNWPAGARDGVRFALTWLVIPIGASFLYSVWRQPIFVSRYLIVALPALVMIAALGVVGLERPALRASSLAILLALAARSVASWYSAPPKADWRAATEYVLGSAETGDVLVFHQHYGSRPFEYYLWRRGNPPDAPRPLVPTQRWGQFDVLWRTGLDRDEAAWLRRESFSVRRVWLILSHNRSAEEAAVLRWHGGFSARADRSFPGVRVVLYAR